VDRVFLDANVLFSAAYRKQSGLLRLWQLADVELISSFYAAGEAERNLTADSQRQRLRDLLGKLTVVMPSSIGGLPQGVTLPDKDVPILLAAISASATHLLTGDKTHFGPLFGQTVGGVLIQPPASFLAAREAPDPGDRPTA
jgi:predicted nucleic acid-binding protein